MKNANYPALAAFAAESARWVAILGKPSENLTSALARRAAGIVWRQAARVAIASNLKFSTVN